MGRQQWSDNFDSRIPKAAGHTVTFTAGDLIECFRKARLPPRAMPTLEVCERLLPFLPPGRPSDVAWTGERISPKAAKAARALLAELPAIQANWQAHFSCIPSDEDTPATRIWDEAVFRPLTELQRLLQLCKGLIAPTPDPFPESRKAAIIDLHVLFCESMRLVAPDRTFGVSADGPCARFIGAALPRLGYGSVTGDTIEECLRGKKKIPTAAKS